MMSDSRLPYEVINGVPIVMAPEEIDITTAPDLRSALQDAAAAADGQGTIVLDMTRTNFCDSSGIHTLLAAHKRAQEGGSELLLVIPDPAALRVFAITGVDRVIANVPSLEEALVRKSGHRTPVQDH
jgi:anti-sigma B factor antagonist